MKIAEKNAQKCLAHRTHPRGRCAIAVVPLWHNLSLFGPPVIFLGIRKISGALSKTLGPIQDLEILEIFGQILVRGPTPDPSFSQVVGPVEAHHVARAPDQKLLKASKRSAQWSELQQLKQKCFRGFFSNSFVARLNRFD